MGIHQGFILDSPGVVGVVYSILRSSVELDISTPMSFDQFLALTKFQQLSTCYFDDSDIFLINKFCPSFMDKVLE